MRDTNDEVVGIETYIAQREKEATEKGEPKPRIRPNINFNSFVLNEVEDVDLEYTSKNKLLEIKVFNSEGKEVKYGTEINSNQEYTFKVTKLDEKDTTTIDKDLKNVKWCFWLPEITGFSNKEAKHIFIKKNRPEHSVDFLAEPNTSKKMLAIKSKAVLYAKKEIIEKEGKKTAILKVKFSKWLDNHKIKVEAYLHTKKGKGNTVATRLLTAKPEILKAYWLSAAGRKITYTGYKQDAYLYIKTLGLTGKTLETQVFDADVYYNPSQYLIEATTDDKVDWKDNKIKIDSREVIKQFKVGNIKRYESAQADEAAEDNVIGLYNYDYKKINDLELYIHIANSEALKIENVKSKYGQLKLTTDQKIKNAFFAKTEITEVQADAPEIKTKKGTKLPPKAKVPYYEKLDNGVIGQKIQLVAECANLEGETLAFKILEKEPILTTLVDHEAVLPVLQNNKKVTEIKATVKDGFAVAEIELKHSKEHIDNKDWLDKLKNGYHDTKGKTSNLFIIVEKPTEALFAVKSFLKQNLFKLISNNWHEPVDDPQIAIYNQHGVKKTKSNTFGMGRDRFHSGLDIFSKEGSKVYACLDAEVFEIQKWTSKTKSGYGHNVTLKVKRPQEIRNRKREYTKAFTDDLDQKSGFDKNSDIFLLRYAHLEDVLVKKGQQVKAGDSIGKSGVSGIALGTHDPHVHFNIYSTAKLEKHLVNPAYYVYWKEIGDLTATDKKVQEDRKDEGYKPNPVPTLSKIK